MTDVPRSVQLNSLLLAYESAVLRHYELAAVPFFGGEEQDLIDKKVSDAAAAMVRIRKTIIQFVDEGAQ
jgi:hypothetical protein